MINPVEHDETNDALRNTVAKPPFNQRLATVTLLSLCLALSVAARAAKLSDHNRLYLTHRPALGEVFVVDLSGESYERKVLAASLQGVVNKKQARLYLLDKDKGKNRPWETGQGKEAAAFWLDLYQKNYSIKISGEGKLNDALQAFASEAKGYVIASVKEPWTINAATTLAAKDNLLIVFEKERDTLQSLGLREKANLVGKWKDASGCYMDLWKTYYEKMPHKGLGILNPEEYRLRDFLIQQGFLTIYARPHQEGWETILAIVNKTAQNVPVFGYLSLTGQEEFIAVSNLSKAGKYLIPSDTTPNLSFHVAVPPHASFEHFVTSKPDRHRKCDKGRLNVTIAITDGDNLVIPINRYTRKTFWQSDKRGELPVGWSFALSLPAVAPAATEFFLSTRTKKDELVGMLGIGYALSSYYKDSPFFLSRSFEQLKRLGLPTFWVLDVPLYQRTNKTWHEFDKYALDGHPIGILLGYIGLGKPFFRTRGGRPVLVAINAYEDKPDDLVSRIERLLEMPDKKRPPVVFISATGWHNPYSEMVEKLKPLEKKGVNFLLPHEAFACIP